MVFLHSILDSGEILNEARQNENAALRFYVFKEDTLGGWFPRLCRYRLMPTVARFEKRKRAYWWKRKLG